MRYIRFGVLAIITIGLVTVAVANRQVVQLKAMPEFLSGLLGLAPTISLPLFLVIFAGVAVGLLVGFVWEWMREHKHRAEARSKGREAEQLRREVTRLKGERAGSEDEVLKILEQTS